MIGQARWRWRMAALILCGLMLAGLLPAAEVEPVGRVSEASGWRAVTLVEGLEHPWGLAFLPDGDLLVTERPGRLRRISDGQLRPDPVSGVPAVLAVGQGGLLDIALHPAFARNGYVYLTYAAGTVRANQTTIARGVYADGALREVEVLLAVEPIKSGGQHFGSRLLWLPDGTFLASIGDGGNPPLRIDGMLAREHARRPDSLLGKVVRLNDDGSIPDDNPFLGRDGFRPELFTIGHRNIQGLAYDREHDRIWANEHGPRGGDELNLLEAGADYGWPDATYGADYRTGQRFTPHRTLPEAQPPLAVWTPAVAPSGLRTYTGPHFPAWHGHLLSGGLVAREVRLIELEGDMVVAQRRLPIGSRVRLVTQGPDGHIYVLTDERNGRLLRIEPQP